MARRLTTIAKYIQEHVKGLSACAYPTFSSTDSPIAGTRLRRPGKGRSGYALVVWVTWMRSSPPSHRAYDEGVVLIHDSSETYRTNNEVEEWLSNWNAGRRVSVGIRDWRPSQVLSGTPWGMTEDLLIRIGHSAACVLGLDDASARKEMGFTLQSEDRRTGSYLATRRTWMRLARECGERTQSGWALEPSEKAACRRAAAAIRKGLER